MFEMGLLVGIGVIFTLVKLPWNWKLRIISNPVTFDVIVFAALTLLHWGTFSGVMVATIGALFCSITLSIAKWLVGYTRDGKYYAGKFNVIGKLRA